ncbi:MAG: hypothetical protein WCO89_13790, partial [Syntrophus sp. (in: bacteria)]
QYDWHHKDISLNPLRNYRSLNIYSIVKIGLQRSVRHAERFQMEVLAFANTCYNWGHNQRKSKGDFLMIMA